MPPPIPPWNTARRSRMLWVTVGQRFGTFLSGRSGDQSIRMVAQQLTGVRDVPGIFRRGDRTYTARTYPSLEVGPESSCPPDCAVLCPRMAPLERSDAQPPSQRPPEPRRGPRQPSASGGRHQRAVPTCGRTLSRRAVRPAFEDRSWTSVGARQGATPPAERTRRIGCRGGS
jgi:hypothetical protein